MAKQTFNEENTYWNNKGQYAKYDKKLWAKYIPSQGVNLTASQAANKAIIEYRTFSQAYRSFYNNGSGVSSPNFYVGKPDDYQSASDIKKMIKLERQMNKIIVKTWKATKGAKLPVVLGGHSEHLPSYRRD